jgi:ABC-type cobalt transport system substrate-binding protein
MRRIALSMLAVVIAVAAAVILLRSPSTRTYIAAEASAMMPIAEMHAKIDPAKLPVDDFEDQALVFTAKQKD